MNEQLLKMNGLSVEIPNALSFNVLYQNNCQ